MKVPLIQKEKFTLYKVIPIATYNGAELTAVLTKSEYIYGQTNLKTDIFQEEKRK